ncbi:MAG TPA: zinc ribbon domain-containing protein [Candidatus Angelobacter sp.]|nr:zinc ribbon domain-containing protein [Candidatus Angelobacter sp.]
MNRFSEEVRIISPIAWFLAVLGSVGMFLCLYLVAIPRDPRLRHWPPIGQLLFSLWPAVLILIWILLIGYINADARRRGMRYVMWTLLAVFVPNTIGIILYFVLRDPLLVRCAQCGMPGRTTFVFCPQCGGELCPVCPGCRRSIEPSWKKCAYCGAQVGPRAIPPELQTSRS